MTHKLLFVTNSADFFLSHRLSLAKAAQKSGYEIFVVTPLSSGVAKIRAHHFNFYALDLHRSSLNPYKEFKTIYALCKMFKKIQPDLVHAITLKPVIYAGIAGRLTKVPRMVYALTGLGYVFIANSFLIKILRSFIRKMFGVCFKHPNACIIFQNRDDLQELQNSYHDRCRAVVIRGSGISLSEYCPKPVFSTFPTVLLASRMLWDKGIGEFVAAAKVLKKEFPEWRFVLIGETDPANPAHIPTTVIMSWVEEKIEWWGKQNNMQNMLNVAEIVCLPSYREGLPRVLIEACACAKPIVTTDVPGCREIVQHEENGFLIPPKNVDCLVGALRNLMVNAALRKSMGLKGREWAQQFSEEVVNQKTLDLYRQL